MAGNLQGRGLTAVRICLGVFFLAEAVGKAGWLLDSSALVKQLTGWLATAGSYNRWYLEQVCLPGAAIFARMVLVGETATALALILGAYTRSAAALALLMVLNFHVASGTVFKLSFLNSGYGLPVVGGLLALAIGGASLPWSLKR